jgi:PAS domain S-box-containing protein
VLANDLLFLAVIMDGYLPTLRAAECFVGDLFTTDWVKATLILALITTWMVIALCGYLARDTRQRHFLLWTLAWIFYSGYLSVSFVLEDMPGARTLLMARLGCLGMSALFMLWGVLSLQNPRRNNRILVYASAPVMVWSYAATYWLPQGFGSAGPVFWLFSGASIAAGLHYRRECKGNRPATMLAFGFILWGAHLALFSFLSVSPAMAACGYALSATLSLAVAIGLMAREETAFVEQKYRSVLDAASDAIFIVDLWDLKIVDANRAAFRLTKREPGDLLGKPVTELCPDLQKNGDNLLDRRTMFNGVFRPFSEFQIMAADGTAVVCQGDSALAQWRRRPVIQLNVRPVDETRQVGQLMRRAEKLSSLGQLVAGVAHELNNPLAVVVGYAQLMAKQIKDDHRLRDNVLRVLHESERAAKIVGDLLAFARPCEPQLVTVNIGSLVRSVLDSRAPDLRGYDIQFETAIAPDLPETKADPIQIEQVLNNLITNAIHAMGAQTTSRRLRVSADIRGLFIRIAVSDNGPGIPSAIREKIFEPFFTTKPPGKGTGLGLSICNTILQEHHGRLFVESEFGRGATFFIELPVVACEAATPVVEAPVAKVAGSDNCGERRLLIVDDEPGIREVLKEVLLAGGYDVETAGNGVEAMQRIQSERFDLIISDLCMPEMDGERFYRSVSEKSKALASRIIFVTGDTVNPKSRAFLESAGNRWLSKPFNIRAVEEIVREVLDKGSAGLN